MKWFFLNIITCVIDFFAMASPGCFSCADLFSPDCVCVAPRRGTPAGSGSSSSFVPHGLISSGCLGRGMWHFIHLLTQSFGAGSMSSPRSSWAPAQVPGSQQLDFGAEGMIWLLLQSPSKQVVTRAITNLSFLQAVSKPFIWKLACSSFSIQFSRGNRNLR